MTASFGARLAENHQKIAEQIAAFFRVQNENRSLSVFSQSQRLMTLNSTKASRCYTRIGKKKKTCAFRSSRGCKTCESGRGWVCVRGSCWPPIPPLQLEDPFLKPQFFPPHPPPPFPSAPRFSFSMLQEWSRPAWGRGPEVEREDPPSSIRGQQN